jgi:hypothetical protein
VRGTQSLLHICVACWKQPNLLGRELLWRWAFGLPAAAILYYQATRIAAHVTLNPSAISLNDPVEAGQQLAVAAAAIKPEVERAIAWLGPLLAVAWAVASGFGRSAVLKSIDSRMRSAPFTLIVLQLLRMAALVAVCLGWYRALRWAADTTLDSAAPNLVAWSAWVICLSLGIFVLWALLSWIFSVAPLLAMLEGKGVFPSLARSLHLGELRSKLVEVNLVLGIVRLALIVLAIVFSAIPLPFTADMSGAPLYLWWAFVTLLYLVASDFFQVARLAAFVDFWRVYHPEKPSQVSW